MEKREANEIFQNQDDEIKQENKKPQQSRDNNDLSDFEIPVECVPLPTRGVVYSSTSSLYNRNDVDIKCMTAKDEDILTSRALIRKGTVIDKLLQSCIVDRTININEMLLGDRNAIMVALRITGYGSEYRVGLQCPSCENKYEEVINLIDLPIKRLKIEPIAQNTNQFLFTLPRLNKEVIFKFMDCKDEKELSTIIDRSRKITELESIVTTRLVKSIISIGGITDRSKISRIVQRLPASDSLALRNYINDNEPGINMKSFTICTGCNWDGEVDVPLGATFFWPGS